MSSEASKVEISMIENSVLVALLVSPTLFSPFVGF